MIRCGRSAYRSSKGTDVREFEIVLYFRGPTAPLPFLLIDNVDLAPKVIQGQSATPISLVTAVVTA